MVVKAQTLQQAVPAAGNDTQQRTVTILGATGSVGCQTIDLIERAPERYRVLALTAHRNVAKLAEQARKLRPEVAVIADAAHYHALKDLLAGTGIKVAAGEQAVVEAAQMPAEWVMAAIVGAAGLPSTLAAARRGAIVAFANKETLVCAGPLMMDLVAQSGAKLLPVDSEHNAIWQVFDFDRKDAITRLILTASGGPFRTMSRAAMASVTPQQAVKHPVWAMGAKISIDSATLMNKGLEVIEAAYLFGMPEEKIDVVVHPQSVIHSMVEYADGSVLAQLGTPDMRTPIGYTLAWPNRMVTPAARLDFAQLGSLTFEKPDPEKFPALRLTRAALRTGGTAPAILNAANEIAVQAFLDGQIGFLDIERINEATMGQVPSARLTGLDVLADADMAARRHATAMTNKKAS
jgi:1-deoxy-D-xylulose-5-phosphate reductoisomerase